MDIQIQQYTHDRVPDVIAFERQLRAEESVWGWEVDDAYRHAVEASFGDPRFAHSVSLLAYDGTHVVGRIDSTLICSHFDGSVKAYLDWICVLKSCRHLGIAQQLMTALRAKLREAGASELVGIVAHNEDSLRFYHGLERATVQDEGIWIEL